MLGCFDATAGFLVEDLSVRAAVNSGLSLFPAREVLTTILGVTQAVVVEVSEFSELVAFVGTREFQDFGGTAARTVGSIRMHTCTNRRIEDDAGGAFLFIGDPILTVVEL